MSALGDRVAQLTQTLVSRFGSELVYGGTTYPCIAEEASAAKAGAGQDLGERWGEFAAAADPRVFSVSARLFTPVTAAAVPVVGSTLQWHGVRYLIAAVVPTDVAGATATLLLYAHRVE